MLGSLCTLITALTCVSGVTLVTQKPPVVALTTGQTATMDCNLGTVTSDTANWYKQVPGGVPQYVLRFYHGWSSVEYGSGFSAPKFTSNHQSQTDYRLIIKNVEEGDSAIYYCTTWDDSAKQNVFGQGTKLIVTGSTLPPPVLTVFPPSTDELQSNKATLVCVASLPSPSLGFADVTWTAAGSPVSSGVSSSSAVQQPDQTFHISSYLAIQTADWKRDKAYTCQVSVGSKASEKSIKKSDCST
ncbi:immunoglobulin lambda-1 light chain-like [Myripristis murdjan]|uniref:immunoglobulin lambda-1 light chain-like n=1 Tax=Myripristis murdjan TaxID=586833 RepID=UPI001175E572|nr:immunoglobulin lambda-1 light chain-like [Myripristis murdjan]